MDIVYPAPFGKDAFLQFLFWALMSTVNGWGVIPSLVHPPPCLYHVLLLRLCNVFSVYLLGRQAIPLCRWFQYPATLLSLSSSSPICITLISFSCLIALASISSTILKGTGGSEHHFLIPDFGGFFSPLCGSLVYSFYYVELCSF